MESNNIFHEAMLAIIEELPKEFDASDIIFYKNNNFSFHFAYNVLDEISKKYIGRNEEIIFRCLCDAIYHSIHEAAEFCVKIRPLELREYTIKRKFEEIILDSISRPELGWNENDAALARKYIGR